MSGGYYNYMYHQLYELANLIEEDLTEKRYCSWLGRKATVIEEMMHGEDMDKKTLVEIVMRRLIGELRKLSGQARELEWFMSSDTGYEDFLKAMEE